MGQHHHGVPFFHKRHLEFSFFSCNTLYMSTKTERKYGWRKDVEDSRDYLYSVKKEIDISNVKPIVDLRAKCPVIVDQGLLNSCVGNAVAGALQHRQLVQGKIYYDPAAGRTKPYDSYVFAPS